MRSPAFQCRVLQENGLRKSRTWPLCEQILRRREDARYRQSKDSPLRAVLCAVHEAQSAPQSRSQKLQSLAAFLFKLLGQFVYGSRWVEGHKIRVACQGFALLAVHQKLNLGNARDIGCKRFNE